MRDDFGNGGSTNSTGERDVWLSSPPLADAVMIALSAYPTETVQQNAESIQASIKAGLQRVPGLSVPVQRHTLDGALAKRKAYAAAGLIRGRVG